jgi:S1-C subfamily serine protease
MKRLFNYLILFIILISCNQNPPDPSELYQKYRSSVVLIKNEYYFQIGFNNEVFRFYTIDETGEPTFFENETDAIINASMIFGTGFFISADGKIATNRHVIFPDSQEDILIDKFHNIFSEVRDETIDYINYCEDIKSSLDSIQRNFVLNTQQMQLLNDSIISTQNEIISNQKFLSDWDRFDKKNTSVLMKTVSISIAFDNSFVTNSNDFIDCVPISIPENPDLDLALIQIKTKDLPPRVTDFFNINNYDPKKITLSINDDVYMIGFNYGITLATTSEGIKNQFTSGRISQEGDNNKILYSIPTLPGSSGSPIIDKWGNLVAINFAKIKETQSFSYGIPVKNLFDLFSGSIASQNDFAKPARHVNEDNTTRNNPAVKTTKINKPQDYSETIRQFLKAEDERDFSKIYSYYADTLRRYWNINNPSLQDLKNQYEIAWKATSSSKNTILQISKLSQDIYEVKLIFDYFHIKKRKQMSVQSTIKIYFNKNGKVVEVFGI